MTPKFAAVFEANAAGLIEIVISAIAVAEVLAARLRVRHKLRLADAIQVTTALSTGADALVTHDRAF